MKGVFRQLQFSKYDKTFCHSLLKQNTTTNVLSENEYPDQTTRMLKNCTLTVPLLPIITFLMIRLIAHLPVVLVGPIMDMQGLCNQLRFDRLCSIYQDQHMLFHLEIKRITKHVDSRHKLPNKRLKKILLMNQLIAFETFKFMRCNVITVFLQTCLDIPESIRHKYIANRYRPVRVADGPIRVRCRFIKNASSDVPTASPYSYH